MLNVYVIFGILYIVINGAESIINGRIACQGQFPYMATIWFRNVGICGGSIISEKHILTAAHCIGMMKETDCSVTVGVANINNPSRIRVRCRNFHPHPNYKRLINLDNQSNRLVINDIAIIELLEELTWTPTVQPVELWRTTRFPHCECHIAGWGAIEKGDKPGSPDLRWAQVYIMNTQACRAFKMTGPNELCLVHPVTLAAAAPGDSGGPLVCGGKVVGIMVSAKKYQLAPTVALVIYFYLSWIDGIVGSSLPRPAPTKNVFEFLNEQGLLCT